MMPSFCNTAGALIRRLLDWLRIGNRRPIAGAAGAGLDRDRLILLPIAESKLDCLAGFWRCVELLAADDYVGAIKSLYWPRGAHWTPEGLKEQITTFFGHDPPWSVVVPNERLVGVLNDLARFEPLDREGVGWFLAHIPLTTEPADPEDDAIHLMGLAASFAVRRIQDVHVLEFIIFHA